MAANEPETSEERLNYIQTSFDQAIDVLGKYETHVTEGKKIIIDNPYLKRHAGNLKSIKKNVKIGDRQLEVLVKAGADIERLEGELESVEGVDLGPLVEKAKAARDYLKGF